MNPVSRALLRTVRSIHLSDTAQMLALLKNAVDTVLVIEEQATTIANNDDQAAARERDRRTTACAGTKPAAAAVHKTETSARS